MAFPSPAATAREIAPFSHQVWLNEQRRHATSLDHKFRQWMAAIELDEELFQQHVYGKAEPTALDFRQHRACLCRAISVGETLAVEILAGNSGGDGATYVDRIDERLACLRAVLQQWHGNPAHDPGLPLSLREGMAEAIAGKDLEELASL